MDIVTCDQISNEINTLNIYNKILNKIGGIINTSVTYDGNNVKFVNPISGASEENDQITGNNVFSKFFFY